MPHSCTAVLQQPARVPDLLLLSGCLLSRAMDAQLVTALLALLALTSLGAASELDCKELVKPLVLDSHSPIYGKWVLHVGSWDKPGLKSDLVTVNGSWVDLSPSSDSGVISIYWSDRLNGNRCLQGLANATITGMTSHTTFNINGHTSYHDGKYYETCADCLLSEDTTLLPDGKSKGRYLYLFTRTGTLEPSELETFKKQAECLNFLPEYHFGGTELCPDNRVPALPSAESTGDNQTDVEPPAE
uniref:Apolipoprotein M n=1 Tax=Gasterosteus aculeatus aculeatus TaxID=481459 RepID=G3P723_GASAC